MTNESAKKFTDLIGFLRSESRPVQRVRRGRGMLGLKMRRIGRSVKSTFWPDWASRLEHLLGLDFVLANFIKQRGVIDLEYLGAFAFVSANLF